MQFNSGLRLLDYLQDRSGIREKEDRLEILVLPPPAPIRPRLPPRLLIMCAVACRFWICLVIWPLSFEFLATLASANIHFAPTRFQYHY